MSNLARRRIILTGFMGAGKTTVAATLASRLNCRLIDLDELIALREGRSIPDIIDADGEARFREIETRALAFALEDTEARVIALGGGTWTLEQNRALIRMQDCFTVWLDAPFDLCWQRITREGVSRPLARDKERAQELYETRRASYAGAELHLQITDGKSAEAIAGNILEQLAN